MYFSVIAELVVVIFVVNFVVVDVAVAVVDVVVAVVIIGGDCVVIHEIFLISIRFQSTNESFD